MNALLETAHRPHIAPARAPRTGFHSERLLVIDPYWQRFGDYRIAELPGLFGPRDLLVLNDAATLPASLQVDPQLELRLLARLENGRFRAITLGAGDYRMPTEARGEPRRLKVGERLRLGPDLSGEVTALDARDPRLVELQFDREDAALWSSLYRHGRPIQYSYLSAPLQLWDVQNRYASRPWAFELPSAGRPLTFELLFALEKRGARLAALTHAASISSTGSAELDARLPLAERSDIPEATASAVGDALRTGGRVVAIGTSVTRALEAAANGSGSIRSGSFETELRLSSRSTPSIVSGLLTGLHEPGTSHFELLESLAPRRLLLNAVEHAARSGYLQHEFGDSCLILGGGTRRPPSPK
jgi:S-adenosylmethionine:tRNA ribosyltransferase-isomerase